MSYGNKKALVTGGAGFIGSHLCASLLLKGFEVICLDNLFTGTKENISHLFENPRFEFIRHDVVSNYSIDVDYIFNLACPASPVHYQNNPVRTLETNLFGAINMLNLANSTGARILQASTSEVYGDPDVHPQNEEYWGNVNPIGIRSCYDEGKRCAETLFFDYHRKYNTRIKVIRIFNTYGPKMHPEDGRVVSNLIIQALNGEDLTIYGDGSQTRSFCYVDDLVDGIIKMMDSDEKITGPVNLGNPGEFTILELAKMVKKLTGAESEIKFLPLPQDDPRKRKPDISKAGKLLAWEPKIKLEEGLIKTIDYFKKIVNN